MTGPSSVGPVSVRHVEAVPTFVVEGHLYETADQSRRFYVFTAGDGSVWSATEPRPDERGVGRYLVRAAPDRESCVKQLQRALAVE